MIAHRNIKVLMKAYQDPFMIQSDFAREFALEVAACASSGLITTTVTPGYFGRKWYLTIGGMMALDRMGAI